MTPYGTFSFFSILFLLLIPIIILGLNGKRVQFYTNFVTVVILLLVFANDHNQLLSLIFYMVWQVILVKSYFRHRQKENKSWIFYIAVILSILPLMLVKILPFLHINSMIGFLGISYLTFKTVEILMNTRDGLIKEIKLKDLLHFLLFFPSISSGPIDRFKRFKQDMDKVPTKDEYRQLLHEGINKIFLGFLYKFIIGYLISKHIIGTEFVSEKTFFATLTYMYGYSLYLFFDFAGYSAFAIGISYLLGIKTPENFHLPFLSRNIKDFWNRWHLSLSFWFRDYVYMRFVFFMTKKKWIKDRFIVSYIGYFLLFFIMGIWHGLEWHFLAYGLYHALLIICFDLFERKNKKKNFWKKNKATNILSIIITFHFICFGFLIFSGRLF